MRIERKNIPATTALGATGTKAFDVSTTPATTRKRAENFIIVLMIMCCGAVDEGRTFYRQKWFRLFSNNCLCQTPHQDKHEMDDV